MAGSHYDVLGVNPGASSDDIRRAYRRLARRHHPDAQPGGDVAAVAAAQRRMAALAAAYAVLADPARRQAYDRAIGRFEPPRPNAPRADWRPVDGNDPDDERYDRLGLDDEAATAPHRPADLVMMVPAALAGLAVVTFCLGVVVQSHRLWAIAVVLAPVAVASFLAAPLVSMLRARSRGGVEAGAERQPGS